MEKEIIEGSSKVLLEKIKEYPMEGEKLLHVTVFFENANFLITKYKILSPNVNMILETNKREIQIEGANCGYLGTGPQTAVSVLERFGISKEIVSPIICKSRALSFDVKDDGICNINTEQLFYRNNEISYHTKSSLKNKIELDNNIDVQLKERMVYIFNPQRTNWTGFMTLLNCMENIQFEYYIGDDSPLEDAAISREELKKMAWNGNKKIDLDGVEHCNLVLRSDNFSVACYIDREYEVTVINAIYMGLTGKVLFEDKTGIFGAISHRNKLKEPWKRINI